MAQMLTQFSSHANTIADTVRSAFASTKIGDCIVEVTAPQESTEGGRRALQHVTLRSAGGDGGTLLVVGTLNAAEKRAEIRSFVEVAGVHEARFKRPVSFDRATYEGFVETLDGVLSAFGLVLTRAEERVVTSVRTEAELAPIVAKRSTGIVAIGAVVAVLIALAGGVVWLLLRE